MYKKRKNINSEHIDALREMGNIGSGHAANALANLLNRRIDMSIPRFSLLSVTELSRVKWRNKDQATPFAIIIIEIKGEMRMDIMIVLDADTTKAIIKLIHPSEKTIEFEKLTEFEKSIITEVGNILALHYLTAISDFLSITAVPGSPILVVESSETILASLATHLHPDFTHLLLIECDIFTSDEKLSPLMIFIPEEQTVEKSLRKLFGDDMI